MIDIILMNIVAALAFTFSKPPATDNAVFFLSALHLLPAGLFFTAWRFFFTDHGRRERITTSTFWIFLVLMALYSFTDVTCFLSVDKTPSSYVALISCLGPLVTALVARVVLKEFFTTRKVFALFLGFFGILPLLVNNATDTTTQDYSPDLMQGYLYSFCTMVGIISIGFILKEIFLKNYSIVELLSIILSGGGIISLILSLVTEDWTLIPFQTFLFFTPLTLCIFVAHNIVAPFLYASVLRKYPITLLSFFSLMTPFFSALVEFFYYQRKVGVCFFLSAILFGSALLLFYSEEKKQRFTA